MRKQAILVLAMVVLLAVSACAFGYSGGDGSAEEPYRIATPSDLNDIGSHPEDFNDCFILVNDINMAGLAYTTALIAPDTDNSSYGFQGTAFTGIFDGNDCSISNLTIDTAGADNEYLGLFGQIGQTGEVKNLGIEDVNITGGADSCRLGGLCGENWYGTISNCYATGSVTGGYYSDSLGGLCGCNHYGTISNCCATGSVTGGDYSGGLGGLCGYNNEGTIRNCYATSSVTGRTHSYPLGGLCGFNYKGTISNCCATGSVTGGADSDSLGGLCGSNFDGTISNCYATGSVTGEDSLGGLVGYNTYADIFASFWDTQTTGRPNGVGYNEGSGTVEVYGRTTAQMQAQSTFTDYGWDFVEIWNIGENQTYPYLRVYPAGDLNHDGRVDFFDFAIAASHWLEGKDYD